MHNIQHLVYTISKTIKLLQENSFTNISVLTELLFQISELDIRNGESITETIIQKLGEIFTSKEKTSKIVNIRIILEQMLLLLITKEELENKNSYFMNLEQCRKNKIFTKKTTGSLGKNYSHISQFMHGEDEITISSYNYAMNNAIGSIKLILNKLEEQTEKANEEKKPNTEIHEEKQKEKVEKQDITEKKEEKIENKDDILTSDDKSFWKYVFRNFLTDGWQEILLKSEYRKMDLYKFCIYKDNIIVIYELKTLPLIEQ